jgi:hypothetical protein
MGRDSLKINFGISYAEGVSLQSPAVAGIPAHLGERNDKNSNPYGVLHLVAIHHQTCGTPLGYERYWTRVPRVAPRG